MPLFQKTEVAILKSINTRNSLNLTLDDITFGTPTAVADMVPAPVTTKNTSVVVTARPGARYLGSVRVNYDRADFSQIFASTPLNTYAKLRAFRPSTIHDLIPALNDHYGLQLTKADIEDGALSLANGEGTAVIQAKATSLGWRGAFTVTIVPGDAKLEDWLLDTDLAGVPYPSGQDVLGQAEVYSYGIDATAYWNALRQIVIDTEGGEAVNQVLVDLVNELTGDSWTLAPGDYSFAGAKVTYNGANSTDKPSNPDYTYIMEIGLTNQCTNFAGTFRIHYNGNLDINGQNVVTAYDFELNSLYGLDPANGGDPNYGLQRHNPMLDTRSNDYTASAASISAIGWQSTRQAAAGSDLTKIVAALTAVDGKAWNVTPGADYSLADGWVAYNGPISAMRDSLLFGMTREEFIPAGFTNVLVFYPSLTQQANLWYGVGFMYYNLS